MLRTLGLLCVMLAASWSAAAERPPNIILILADDLGAKELGCYGYGCQQRQTSWGGAI